MRIGVPKETKNLEFRVGLTPDSVHELAHHGHQIMMETGAGTNAGYEDVDYVAAGATIASDAASVFAEADLIVKVKEPLAPERAMLREGQLLFTYLHLAPDTAQTADLIKSGATCIAYETITSDEGTLPLLTPMSEVAGRLSVQAGAQCLQKTAGGRGILLGGVPGTRQATVVVVGGGVVGMNAAIIAHGMGAKVRIFDKNLHVLRHLDRIFQGNIETLYSNKAMLADAVADADVVVGSVLVPGAVAPKIITREMVAAMRKGSVLVDVAIDQGGCAETARPTTHTEPSYMEEGVVHYCVTNMPSLVARTATQALNNATLPFTVALANQGLAALKADAHFMNGLNVHKGDITCKMVSDAQGLPYVPAEQVL